MVRARLYIHIFIRGGFAYPNGTVVQDGVDQLCDKWAFGLLEDLYLLEQAVWRVAPRRQDFDSHNGASFRVNCLVDDSKGAIEHKKVKCVHMGAGGVR